MRNILEAGYEIAGEVEDGRELVRTALELRPDVVVVDISMPNLNGLDAIRLLREKGVSAKAVVVTMHTSIDFAVQAFRLGATGYVLKIDALGDLSRAVQEALAGRMFISPRMAGDVLAALMEPRSGASEDDNPWTSLTAREREILQLTAEGRKMAEIGEMLHISARTVEKHKYKAMEKLKLRSTAELIQYAIQRGLVHPV
jgi:DNA-binding NarL/FixJ family response regulator